MHPDRNLQVLVFRTNNSELAVRVQMVGLNGLRDPTLVGRFGNWKHSGY